jgi:hypothetical protein
MAVDAFLKFDGLGGEGQKLGNDFDRLGDSFTDLGGAFIKLADVGSSTDTNSFKADFAAQIKHDVFTVGDDFFKIGQGFVKLADPLHKFGDAVVKFTDQFIKLTLSESEMSFPLAADFLKFEADVGATGLDFLAAAPDIKSDAPAENLSLNFGSISVDYKAQGSDASQIAADLTEFARSTNYPTLRWGTRFSNSRPIGIIWERYTVIWARTSRKSRPPSLRWKATTTIPSNSIKPSTSSPPTSLH